MFKAMAVRRHGLVIAIVSLVSGVSAAGNKYCGSAVFRKKGKYCCSKQNAWDSRTSACGNDGSYIKIHKNCGTNRRRATRVCCDSVNAWHGFSTPALPPPPPTPVTPAPPPPPSTPVTPAPAPAPSSYASSSSRYYPGDSMNTPSTAAGACGGANLNVVARRLSTLTDEVGMHYFPVAIAQGMAQPLMCSSANEADGTGSPSIVGAGHTNVLHSYCGQCVQFTSSSGKAVGGVVLDTCPYKSNTEWCSKDGNANQHGFFNHIDFYGSSSDDVTRVVGDNPTGMVKSIACPSAVMAELTSLAAATQQSPQSEVCTWYWDGGKWQGAPGMSDFGCSECSNTRRLNMTSAILV